MTFSNKELNDSEVRVLNSIRNGTFESSAGDKKLVTILTFLRRRGLVKNEGSRKTPKWVYVKTDSELETSPYASLFLNDRMLRVE